jgi:DNA invertase Pin-like site-specific DNA recombinase
VVEELSDAGLSGKRADNRPALQEALDQLRRGDADALVCAKLDRLARSTVDLAKIMADAHEQDWSLVLLDVNVDTSTPAGELVATVLGAMAQYERKLIGERVKAAHRQRKARGLRPGQAPEVPDEIRQRIAAERGEGRSLRAIAIGLNDDGVATARGGSWHASTVKHILEGLTLDDELAAIRGAA